jgi:alpha-1,2-mannosyltransferase
LRNAHRATLAAALGWAAVLCGVLLAQTYVRAERPNGIDLTSYLLSARALAEGRSPYLLPTPFPYLYPATLAFLLIPFTFVPALAAVFVWFVLSVAAAVWSIRAVLLQTRPSLANRSAAVAVFLACFFTLFFTIAQSNLRNGQVNFIVLALCVAAGLAAAPRGAPAWSLAVAMKIFPLAWLPYFLLRRSWLWLAAAVGLIAVWCLLPAVVLGPRIVDIYEQYGRVFLVMSLEPRQQPLDFSLAGTIAWIARVPMTPVLKASAAAVVLGWILQADARRLRTTTNVRAFALYSLAIPLVSPQSEVHHLAFMLPAAAVVGAALWSDWPQAGRLLTIASVIAAALYLAATATPIASGPLFCASLIAFGVALLQTSDVVDH